MTEKEIDDALNFMERWRLRHEMYEACVNFGLDVPHYDPLEEYKKGYLAGHRPWEEVRVEMPGCCTNVPQSPPNICWAEGWVAGRADYDMIHKHIGLR